MKNLPIIQPIDGAQLNLCIVPGLSRNFRGKVISDDTDTVKLKIFIKSPAEKNQAINHNDEH